MLKSKESFPCVFVAPLQWPELLEPLILKCAYLGLRGGLGIFKHALGDRIRLPPYANSVQKMYRHLKLDWQTAYHRLTPKALC